MCFPLNFTAPPIQSDIQLWSIICNGCHTLFFFFHRIFRAHFKSNIIYVIAKAHNLFLGSYFTISFWRANFANLRKTDSFKLDFRLTSKNQRNESVNWRLPKNNIFCIHLDKHCGDFYSAQLMRKRVWTSRWFFFPNRVTSSFRFSLAFTLSRLFASINKSSFFTIELEMRQSTPKGTV